jgi:hypothetical protein
MTKLTIMRSQNDNKAWFVDSDGAIVSEIENEALVGECARESETSIVVEVRAHAASHNFHTV